MAYCTHPDGSVRVLLDQEVGGLRHLSTGYSLIPGIRVPVISWCKDCGSVRTVKSDGNPSWEHPKSMR